MVKKFLALVMALALVTGITAAPAMAATQTIYAGQRTDSDPGGTAYFGNIIISGGFHISQSWTWVVQDGGHIPLNCMSHVRAHNTSNGYSHDFTSPSDSWTGSQDTWLPSTGTSRWEFTFWTTNSDLAGGWGHENAGYCTSNQNVWQWT